MDKLRQIVGGPKNRYRQSGYNLDLTYITPKLIAMAFPASGIQKLYRNSIDDVVKFFTQNHGGSYLIINLSGRDIDESKLPNTLTFDWDDHQAPPLQMLFKICEVMGHFLNQHEKRVVGVHCNHGKGRTGTIICCFLLYCGMFKNEQLVREYYAKKRFEKEEGFGVTQPCQIQYIKYFQQVLNGKNNIPRVVAFKKVVFRGAHKFSNLYFKAKYFTSNNPIVSTKSGKTNALSSAIENQIEIKMLEQKYFAGDIKLIVKAPSKISSSSVANYSFNTAFLPEDIQNVEIPLTELSPYSIMKSDNFSKDFKIIITFRQICKCKKDVPFHLRCEKCRDFLIEQEHKWKKIRQILSRREKINQQQKFFMLGLEESKKKMEQI